MEITPMGQTFYPQEADEIAPEGCIATFNEHGACIDRGCQWCIVYYDGPDALEDCFVCHGSRGDPAGPCLHCRGSGKEPEPSPFIRYD
jgi:hypothetical protein